MIMIMTLIKFHITYFFWFYKFLLTKKFYLTIIITILITIIKNMPKIFRLKTKENKNFYNPFPTKYERVKMLYNSLLNSGYTSCQAFHEAMKLLTVINPNIELSEVSKTTFHIVYPFIDNYYEYNIDNHSHN